MLGEHILEIRHGIKPLMYALPNQKKKKLICLGPGTVEEREMPEGKVTHLRSTSDRLRF